MRGLLVHTFTRIYFEDEAGGQRQGCGAGECAGARRGTLVAKREATGAGPQYRFDIHMQGDKETVFFDL
jgi:protocatechuate 3,4-dioxygenase alpha subunit